MILNTGAPLCRQGKVLLQRFWSGHPSTGCDSDHTLLCGKMEIGKASTEDDANSCMFAENFRNPDEE
jgi:hypothetical protein